MGVFASFGPIPWLCRKSLGDIDEPSAVRIFCIASATAAEAVADLLAAWPFASAISSAIFAMANAREMPLWADFSTASICLL
ncbi:hypothetical protein A7R75_26920 [Mycolicibacterium llatzerense]|nr:hypothetical protein [Mycolicibacterium llatzerense]